MEYKKGEGMKCSQQNYCSYVVAWDSVVYVKSPPTPNTTYGFHANQVPLSLHCHIAWCLVEFENV